MKNDRLPLIVIVILAATALPAKAWHHEGHMLIAHGAVAALPAEVPQFFREGGDVIANVCVDPDLMRDRLLPQVRDQESPEHYIDLEELKGAKLPPTRSAYLKLIEKLDVSPDRAGFLPYSISEWNQRLTMAFAEYRKWPNIPAIRYKALVYAGIMCHYAGDASMPLHTTVDFDGRVVNGRSSHTGIHSKVDDLLYRFTVDDVALPDSMKVTTYDNVFASVVDNIMQSHSHVDQVYALEKQFPKVKQNVKLTPDVRAFAIERARHGIAFNASLFYTAWVKSASIKLPDYLDFNKQH